MVVQMSTQDRLLLGVSGASGCVSLWLVFQSVTQLTLRPTASATDLMFLVVVTGAIVGLLLRRGVGKTSDNANNPGPAVLRRPLLLAGGIAAVALVVLTRVVGNLDDPGSSNITLAPQASLAGFAGVGVLVILLRLTYLRMQDGRESEMAPGPPGGGDCDEGLGPEV